MNLINSILFLSLLVLLNTNIRSYIHQKIKYLRFIKYLETTFYLFIILNSGILIYFSIYYLNTNIFLDHIEPHMATVSWFFDYNKTIYTGPESAERYSLAYGPITYLSNYLSMKLLGPSIFSSKITCSISLILTLLVLFLSLKKITKKTNESLFLIGFMSMVLMSSAFAPVGIRNDSLSYLIISLSIFLCTKRNIFFNTFLFSFLIFLQLNIKPHFVFSLLPPLFYYLNKIDIKFIYNITTISLSIFLLNIFLWFGFENISILNYIFWINTITNNGFFLETFIKNFLFSLIWIIPIIFFQIIHHQEMKTKEKFLFLTIIIVSFLDAFLGSRRGGGTPIFFPLLPSIIFLIAIYINKKSVINLRVFKFLYILFSLMFFSHSSTKGIYKKINYLNNNDLSNQQIEIKEIIEKYKNKNITMGYGASDEGNLLSYLSPLLSFHKENFIIDLSHLVETIDDVKISTNTLLSIKNCEINYIILPQNEKAFEIKPWGINIFDENFINTFYSKFQIYEKLNFYDVWKCRKT